MIKILRRSWTTTIWRSCATSSMPGFKTVTLPMSFNVAEGGDGLRRAMDDLCAAASYAITDGATILILSDRGMDKDHAPIPSLLATSGVHHHLVREGTRTKATLIVETGEAREVHHYLPADRLRRIGHQSVSGV